MIASLRGTLAFVGQDYAVIETGGVGYLVYAPRTVLGGLPAVGEEMKLHTYLVVREDALTLFGFTTAQQRALFEMLLGVSGVGPRVALNLISGVQPDELRAAVAQNELAELLVNLGYSAAEASAAIASLPADAPPELEERLRLTLRFFGSP